MTKKLTLQITPRALAKLKDLRENTEKMHRKRLFIEPVWIHKYQQREAHWRFDFHEWDKIQEVPAENWANFPWANIDGMIFVYSGVPHMLDDLAQRKIDWTQDGFVFSKVVKKD